MENKSLIANENAIKSVDEDLLNFHPFAEKIQKVIQGYASNPEPLTIGIYGKWGTGKSSLLNLIERHIEIFHKKDDDKRYIKFHYNPWIYQTKEEMLFDFFEMLSKKLTYGKSDNLKKAGKYIKKYSKYLKAVKLSTSVGVPKLFNAGASFEPYEILKRLGEDLEGQEKNLYDLKDSINESLIKSDKKIIIFIDDVDRLDKDEIFTLFKLIKINADFKNLIFIVCLDPDYVAKAIHHRYGDDVESGKEFLEKIINIPLELPLIEKSDLDYFIKQKLNTVLSLRNTKENDLQELFSSLRGNYFTSPREVIRVINSFAVSLFAIGDEVNIHDLFWIEYLKIKYPKTYHVIKQYATTFKNYSIILEIINFNDVPQKDSSESGLRKELMDKHKKAYPIINFLFPLDKSGTVLAYQSEKLKPKRTLDAELRVNHANHFEKYFSFHTIGKISELALSNLKITAKNQEFNRSLEFLKRLKETSGEHRIAYRIISEIETIDTESQNLFFTFLIKNLDEFSEVLDTKPYSVEIVRAIAKKLISKPDENKDLIISIAESLDYIHSCWYLGIILFGKSEITYSNELKKMLVKKTKAISNHPFFKNRSISPMVMDVWSDVSKNDFKKYISKHLNSKENIFSFITSFPNLWNGTINGNFKEEDFGHIMNNLDLDTELIFEKMKKHIPGVMNIKTSEEIDVSWDEHGNNTPLNNVKQFIYWHLLLKEQKEINDTSFPGPPPSK